MNIGDRVFYSSIIGLQPVLNKTYKIKNMGEVGGDPVAWLEGKSGCVSLEALTLATPTEQESFHDYKE